jgi:phosphatidylglycerol:prolipoprotein diacylglycerol transferase
VGAPLAVGRDLEGAAPRLVIPVLYRLGPVSVHAFGAMMALGFLAAGLVLQRDLVRKGAGADAAWAIVGAGAAGGLVGARLMLVAHRWPAFVAAPADVLLSPSGLVWYGGLLGGIVATLWPIRHYGIAWASAADSAALGLALGYAFGKLGCHLAGDGDWGVPTGLPWGVAYGAGAAPWPHPPGVRVHPAPLYELAASLAIFADLWRRRTRAEPPGALFARWLVLAGAARFLVEFVRTNPPLLLGLTEAQWISLALAGGAAAWLARRHRLAHAGAVDWPNKVRR